MIDVLVLALLLVPATVAAGYYFTLTTLGWATSRCPVAPEASPITIAVIIPAHNEAVGLPATLRSVFASDYPAENVHVLVVADNCTDATAAVARQLGAECLERFDPRNRGKGYALAAAIPHVLSVSDAVMILDADCELAPDVLRQTAEALASGAKAIQAARVPRNPEDGPAAIVSAVGSTIENAVSAGRSCLGWSVALRGSGMTFSRAVLERFPWTSYGLTEDAEYAGELSRAGVRVRFLPDAVVTGEVPADVRTLARQRKRWRAALWGGGPGLFARWMASKPLVLIHLAGTVVAVGVLTPGMWVWGAGIVGLTVATYVRAVRRSGVGGWSRLMRAGWVVTRLAGVTLAGFADRGRAWERTTRAGESV